MTSHHEIDAGALSADVIRHDVVLKAICSLLVAALSRAGLRPALRMSGRARLPVLHRVQLVEDGLHGEPLRVLAIARLCGPDYASRQVRNACAVLVFVAVLAARAGARVPFQLEVGRRSPVQPRVVPVLCRVKDGDNNGTGVDATSALCRRDALDAVAPALSIEGAQIVADDMKLRLPFCFGQSRMRPARARAEANIGFSKISDEQGGVFPTLGLVDFDDPFHLNILARRNRKRNHGQAAPNLAFAALTPFTVSGVSLDEL